MLALARRLLPQRTRAAIRRLVRALRQAMSRTPLRHLDQAIRRWEERHRFAAELDVSALPGIHVYWANRHLVPLLSQFGFATHVEFFCKAILSVAPSAGARQILSLGSGNCDNELQIAQRLIAAGVSDWRFHCLDLVPEMLARGKAAVEEQGLANHFSFEVADFNRWQTNQRFDVVIANQCLHHVVELESVLDRIAGMLGPGGRFVVSDMIGRNGHQCWPEAREVVERFWNELPDRYRYHRQLRRRETHFLDWDCSVSGFEGIRSQDILPLLCERFHFETFVAYGNVIDPFIDRGFGGHFDPEAEWDREFIDRVHAADVEGLCSGSWTPTHLMAVCSNDPVPSPVFWPPRGPEACIRATAG